MRPHLLAVNTLRHCVCFLLLAMALSQLTVVEAAPMAVATTRPANSIFDPAEIFTHAQERELSEELLVPAAAEGIDIIILALPELGDSPPSHLARSYAQAWQRSDVSVVVLHSPAASRTPRIFFSPALHQLIRPEVINQAVRAGERRAAAEPDDFFKTRAAVVEVIDMMRFWTGSAKIRFDQLLGLRSKAEERFALLQKLRRAGPLAAILAVSALVASGWVTFTVLSRMVRRRFPERSVQTRLGAPYCGGNRIIVSVTTNSRI